MSENTAPLPSFPRKNVTPYRDTGRESTNKLVEVTSP